MGRGYEPLSTEDWAKLMKANVVARVIPKGMAVPGLGGQDFNGGTPLPPVSPTPTPSITPTLTPTPTPSPIPFDSDAEAYLNRVLVAGGTLDGTISGATDTLFKSLKSNSLYSKMVAMYPVLGSSSSSNGLDALNNYNGSFVGGWTANTYNIPNGVNGRFDTSFNPSTEVAVGQDDMSIGFYLNDDKRPTTLEAYETDLGAIDSGGAPRIYLAPYRRQNDETAAYINASITPAVNGIVSDTTGLWIVSRTGSTQNTLFRNGASLNTYVRTSTGKPNANINMSVKYDAPSTYSQYSTRKWSFLFFSTGLSDSEVSTLSGIINTFQTTLGRNTYT